MALGLKGLIRNRDKITIQHNNCISYNCMFISVDVNCMFVKVGV